MKTIIACTDFSPDAANAVQYAAGLAQALRAKLTLFHYFTYPVPATDLPAVFPTVFADELSKDIDHKMAEIKTALAAQFGDIEIEAVTRSWSISEDLEEVFEEQDAGLVVLGMKGRSALVNALFGSTTTNEIRRGKLPLLLVPGDIKYHAVQKILFPCDDYKAGENGALNPLRDLAVGFNAQIEVFTMFDLEKTPDLVPDGAGLPPLKQHIDAALAGAAHSYSFENEATVKEGILSEAQRFNADMVAMIPHHRSLLASLLNQSDTQRVAAAVHLPVLVLPEKG